jgi:hypothetical protein
MSMASLQKQAFPTRLRMACQTAGTACQYGDVASSWLANNTVIYVMVV